MAKNNKLELLTRGLIKENPVLRLVLGTCPTLAVTTMAVNGLGMGVAATFVLICSNIVISALRKIIPDKVRIPAFITVIAGFVTVVQMLVKAFLPALDTALGVFLPLIVVNCIILGRAEAFASKNGVLVSALDGLFQGIGYTVALVIMCVIRELLGSGTFGAGVLNGGEGIVIIPDTYVAMHMIMPVGGFLTLGFVIAWFQWYTRKRQNEKKEGK